MLIKLLPQTLLTEILKQPCTQVVGTAVQLSSRFVVTQLFSYLTKSDQFQVNPYYRIDLGKTYTITSVQIWTRHRRFSHFIFYQTSIANIVEPKHKVSIGAMSCIFMHTALDVEISFSSFCFTVVDYLNRDSDVEVSIGDSTNVAENEICAKIPGVLDRIVGADCSKPLCGRYVFLRRYSDRNDYMNLCEVLAFSSKN